MFLKQSNVGIGVISPIKAKCNNFILVINLTKNQKKISSVEPPAMSTFNVIIDFLATREGMSTTDVLDMPGRMFLRKINRLIIWLPSGIV